MMKPVVTQGHKLYNRLVVGSIPTRGIKIFIYIYIRVCVCVCVDAKRAVEFYHLQNSVENGVSLY